MMLLYWADFVKDGRKVWSHDDKYWLLWLYYNSKFVFFKPLPPP